jgi:hypothetical protein
MYLFFLYIDPGIGSLAAQVILAGMAAFFMFFKNFFRSIFKRSEKDSDNADDEQQSS